jgi:hypothetical protein
MRKVRARRIIGPRRQRDRPEDLPGADAIEFRRLVEVGRDRGEPGEEDHEHERRPLPDVGKHQRE